MPLALWSTGYILALAAGQRFSDEFSRTGWQMAPPDLLTQDPIRTALAVHTQPPLWNLLVGSVGWASAGNEQVGYSLLMFAFGSLIAVLATKIALTTGCGPLAAVTIGVAVGMWPTTFWNSFALNYELPVAVGLLTVASIIASHGYRLRTRHLTYVSLIMTALMLTRSIFHPLVVVAVVVGFAFASRRTAHRVALICAIALPCAFAGAIVVKNYVLVDVPSTTSWSGMNLLRGTATPVPRDDLEQMARRGEISPIGATPPFSEIGSYPDALNGCRTHGLPAVLQRRFTSRGSYVPFIGARVDVPNYNYACYVDVYQQAGKDALQIARRRPREMLRGRVAAARAWFTTYPPADTPVGRWSTLARIPDFDTFRIRTEEWSGAPYYRSLVNEPLSLLVILCGATSIGFLIVAARRRDVSRELRDLAFFTGGAYIFIFAVGIAFEIGEQARFRMSIDQLSATTALVFIAAAARSAKQRRSVRAKVRATTPPSLARIDHARP